MGTPLQKEGLCRYGECYARHLPNTMNCWKQMDEGIMHSRYILTRHTNTNTCQNTTQQHTVWVREWVCRGTNSRWALCVRECEHELYFQSRKSVSQYRKKVLDRSRFKCTIQLATHNKPGERFSMEKNKSWFLYHIHLRGGNKFNSQKTLKVSVFLAQDITMNILNK